uniref:LPD3 domain-containing protein n=1 Tax=Prevotellamassilia timonensis TaxID=1852370 RepID=UPI00402613A3
MGKAEAVSALQRVKRAIDRFWKAVADFLHIHYTSAEEVADRVMKDLLDGVDPRSMMDGGKSLRPETRVNVVEAEAGHGFKNYAEAKTWAKEHIARTYSGEETGGKGDIRISNAAVDKYLSQSAVDKSESKDVHLAVLKVLPDVIRESVDAEQHADFKKGKDGVRSAANGVNPNVTIHRLYGAVRMDGKLYRVKVTLKENTRTKETPKAYSYEATKIELLEGSLSQTEGSHNLEPSNSKSEVSAGQHGNVSGLTSTFPRYSDKSITAANLLNGVEKSYDGGKFFEDYNKIREQFIGEKGAAAADHADEVSTRLDNLGVAREMEADKKDAKAIKMATGWERGADGKWRYEVGDVRFYDGLQLINRSVKTEATLNDLLEDNKDKEALFASYPSLKNMPVVLEDMGYKGAGEYNYGKGTIRLNTYLLTDDDGYFTKPAVEILNHEIQHAIQKIEGFARGGSPAMVRSEIKKQMAEVTKQIRQLRAEGKEAEAKELIKKNRGLYEASVDDDDFGSYKSLAGEVESRNVESRMGMSAAERRASLAAETEDVSREDQIFLTSGDGGETAHSVEMVHKPSKEESILRDVVIEHMKGSGLDVIGTEDGQRVLDMANDDGAKEHRVYHGSGAEFDHFDHSHMGEGEGVQAYGWGTYVTEVEGIGRTYAIQNSENAREHYVYSGDTHGLSEERINEILEVFLDAKPSEGHVVSEYNDALDWYSSKRDEYCQSLAKDASLLNPSDISIVVDKTRNLYTVEIPDDNGSNYLAWNEPLSVEDSGRIISGLFDLPPSDIEEMAKRDYTFKHILYDLIKINDKAQFVPVLAKGNVLSRSTMYDGGREINDFGGVYRRLQGWFGSAKAVSKFLYSLGYAGIKYPAEFRSGGREDNAKNYVIFNENDAEITDHVRFFKTKNGEAYGFTVGGKIYYDPRIANAETPVHEYAHLWASALKANNAKEWNNVVDLMKGTNVWEEVKKTYPELETDDEIADEVLATYSGRRGAERLREEMRKAAAEGDGVMGKAEAVSALQRVKRAIDKFWKAVADFLHIHYTSAEEVADRVMKDLLDGVDPRKFMGDKAQKEKMRYQFMGEKGAGENVRDAEDYTAFASRYGVSADMVKDYALGMETGNLQKANFALTEIRRTMRVANRGMKLSEFGKLFRPVQKELAERYGDIEVLRQEYIDAEMRERGVMEAARKRAEEEAAKRKARADELRLLPEEELDRRYFEAVERGDDAAAREMLDEAARRKGYGDTESEYQGVGAWVAPSNPGYETDEARRDAVGEDSPNLNVEDMAAGYSNQPEDIFVHPDKYSQGLSTSKESGKAIQTAIDDIRNGKKEVKIKVYRAVPTSVKESKLRNGDWVTPSKEYAEMHGNNRLEGKYRIIEDEVPAGELWWDGNDVNEWGFDDGNGYKYKNVENSRKLNDLVTRDDNGEIIAPSKRFDENVEDVRYRTSEELGQEYGSRWIDEQTNEDGRHTTQVKNTLNSYKKFGDWVKRDSGGRNVDVLDASSGLGLGTEWLRENGINVEDVEPYPSENRTAPTYISYGEVKKKYDYIISNAVLNVIPDDWRANVLHNMAEKLKVGGKLVINVRSAESIRKQGKEGETRITLDDPSEILVLRPNGSIKAYQKGFTKAELKEWCEKELGKGYSVEIANDKNAGGSYDTAVVVTKNNESGTIGVASEASHPRRSAQAAPNSSAKLGNNQKIANNLSELSEKLSELSEKLSERGMGAHEFLFNVARAFGLDGNNLNKSFYQDLSNSVGIRISDHSASTNNIYKKNNNDEVYGLVVKLSNHRFKSRDDANYLEYVYYPDKLTDERQREIVGGLRKFLQTGDYALLPLPDRINRSGNFEKANGEETSDIAKHQAAIDLATDLHVEGGVEVLTTTEGLEGKKAKAKGWFDPKTGRVVVVLPNNKNVKDVRETIFHEVVVHKGVRSLVGDENFNTFLDNIYANAEEKIQQSIDDLSQKYGGDKRKATEEYMAGLSEDGEFAKPENQSFFRKVKDFLVDLLRKVGIKLGFKLTDNDLRYILWRSWKNLKSGGRESLFDKAEDVVMQHELGQTDEARSASGENGIMFREGSDELKDVVEKMKADVERLHEGELDDLRSGARAIGGRLSELNKAMRLQRAYDMSTVASVTELAKTMLKNGLLSEMSDYDVRRLLSVVNNVHGKGDIRPYVQKVVDMMVGNRLRNMSKAFDKLLAMRGKKVDARGVEVQGELDLAGQRMADVVWKGIGMSDDDVADMCADAQDRMMSANGAEAAAAATDYAGWQIVMRYNETIRDSKSEEVRLREDLKRAKEDYDAGRMTREAYMEFRESTNDAIRENRIERAEAYEELYEQLGGAYGESIKRAADFKAAEKARVLEIQHNANSDMEGRPARSYRKDTAVDKVLNSSPVQLLFAPLGTFDQMLRMFGSKNVKGEGYLWNRYMRGWLTATENEYTGYRDATAELDAKAAEVLGKGKTWADLFALERKLPKATVRVWDNGEMRELELPQGNLLYIYMVDKMADGRMKLRKMGVTEDDVAAIEDFLDPRLKEIGDWLQEVYLVEKRGKYNEVHERMFGAAMASIDNYFPLKILKDARAENVDVGVEKRESEMASTITGSVVKRTRNALALDLLNSDAFSVVLDHLQQMEHWSAFAEWNRDLNTLLSYKHFRNQVKNMRSAYGSGERLWEAFDKVARIAAGTYTPPKAFADKLAVNIAKGVTAAKISLRVFTALKQFTSFPAYLSDSNPVYLLKGVANPYGSWKWCMENLPLFEKRWKSRMAGDPRLLKNEMDWSLWRDNVVQMAAKWGMTPNGFVDALTVCIGARAMYETRRRKYIRYGYGLEEAGRRAKQDASILYNQTQQSSEGAFLSALQVDRSWYSVLFTVFRNSSMSYTRQLYAALRNTGRRIAGGAKFKGISEAFMAKQMERDGIDPDKASKNAKAEYRKSWINDFVRAGVFGYVLQLAWNCGPYALYMLFGDDEKKGKEMWHDIWTHTAFGSVEGLTGGDVWSAGLQSLWNHYVNGEDFNANSVNKDMPLTSDLLNVVKKVGSDNYGAVNDVLNLLVQAGFGVNPQTLTDAAVAIYDYCGSDVETTKECALLVMRVMNCPQSQMDNIYFDEIDATGEEAKAMSLEEIAERYARYKALRSAPLRALSSDALKAAEKKPRERVLTEAKEQLDGRLMTEEAQRYLDEYEATKKKVTETRALADTDPKAFMQQMPALARSGEFRRYRRVGLYKSEVDKLTKKLLRTSDPAERRALFGKMLDARDKMLKQVREME